MFGTATSEARPSDDRPTASITDSSTAADPGHHTRYTWENGPPSDPNYFPIGVWLQAPKNAAAYADIGINHFVGLWQGPTNEQLDALAAAEMPVIASQNATGLARADDPTMIGWLQMDEPDNAQADGSGGYGPCIPPEEIQARYERMREADPSRPVWLNLGQGVAHDIDRPYVGRGSACAKRFDHYAEYAKGADIVSFDIYPSTSPYDHIRDQLWRVALGVERLREWSGPDKIIWNVIETTHISSEFMPSPHDVRAEVWMSIVHGSMGIVYFAHEWNPTFREAGLLFYPEMRDAVAAINAQLTELAPVINAPTVPDGVAVEGPSEANPLATMVKHHEGDTYVFAVAMRDEPVDSVFRLAGFTGDGEVEVIGEDRDLIVRDGVFRDAFAGYDVHLYRVAGAEPSPWILLPRLVR